ncbi:MAG: hypothetical protein OEM80_06830, partial [Desulfobulbaceae bacterium]|nr:hypothetical protein [Desulfobulbaceae bacterium]
RKHMLLIPAKRISLPSKQFWYDRQKVSAFETKTISNVKYLLVPGASLMTLDANVKSLSGLNGP